MHRGASLLRHRGISKAIKSHTFRGTSRHTDVLHPRGQKLRTEQMKAKRSAAILGV